MTEYYIKSEETNEWLGYSYYDLGWYFDNDWCRYRFDSKEKAMAIIKQLENDMDFQGYLPLEIIVLPA